MGGPDALADNDVLIKGASYRLLEEFPAAGAHVVGVLGAARFVVRSALEGQPRLHDRNGAIGAWESFLEAAVELEPSEAELELATALETVAAELGLGLDVGESQLCAMAIARPDALVLTGDKRAIGAMEELRVEVDELQHLDGRVACLEQVLQSLCDALGPELVRKQVCAEPGADRAVSICFSCASGDAVTFDPAGLTSYVEAMRADAPNVLCGSFPP